MKIYIIDNLFTEDENLTWNGTDHVKPKEDMINFLKEYEDLCLKYNITLSHEDNHGGFIIEEYKPFNIEWVCSASDERNIK